jgi:hypothetical protein
MRPLLPLPLFLARLALGGCAQGERGDEGSLGEHEPRESPARQARLARPGRSDHPDRRETQEHKGLTDFKAPKATWARRVHQGGQVVAV